ncbi:OTU domain-containing protein [Wolbachia endosymbiont of Drosophila pseudotakahashii]|uniref:OTU domain-containing protein n=1 Tax=Wolbachia endosymbiont of Drosophila pseudotakahashii TaxID=375919 RepID=UPI00224F0B56|nr:OTU domain-containing protein [Wolbachia endosymbiont of Drosophila pseudotakahashii]MCX3065156.1 hypothetical protein [Wolbachia endosymbiont of Drosophila pseudotakahashii]
MQKVMLAESFSGSSLGDEDGYDSCDESEDFDEGVGYTNEEGFNSDDAQQEGVPESAELKNFRRELCAQYDKGKPDGQQPIVLTSFVKSTKNSNLKDKGVTCSIARAKALETKGDGNCFFHAAFGEEVHGCYRANKAQEMREEWSKFLSKFESFQDPNMPKALRGYLYGVFYAFKGTNEGIKAMEDLGLQGEITDHGENSLLADSAFYKSYLRKIEEQNYHVFMQEASLLASLANTEIHIYMKAEDRLCKQVFEPNSEMVKGYVPNQRLWGESTKVVILCQDNHYSRFHSETLDLLQHDIVTPEGGREFSLKRIDNTLQENEQGGTSHSKSSGKESTLPIGQSSVSPKKNFTGRENRGLDVSRGEQVSPKVSDVKDPMKQRLYFDESGSANLGSDNNSDVVESLPESSWTSQSVESALSLKKLDARVLLKNASRIFFLDEKEEIELSRFFKRNGGARFESGTAASEFLNLKMDFSGEQRKVVLRLFFFAEFWDDSLVDKVLAFRNLLWSKICDAEVESDIFERYIDHVANFAVSTVDASSLERVLGRARVLGQRVVLNLVAKICEGIFSVYGSYNRGEFMNSREVVDYLSVLDDLCGKDRKNRAADIQLSNYANYEELCSLLGERPSNIRFMISSFKKKANTKKAENKAFSDFIKHLSRQEWKELEKFSVDAKKGFLKECNYYLITLVIDEIIVDEITVGEITADDEERLAFILSMAKEHLSKTEREKMLKRACEYIVIQCNRFIEGIAFNSTKIFSLLHKNLSDIESEFVSATILKMCVIENRTSDRQSCENVLPVDVGSGEGGVSDDSFGESIKNFLEQYRFDRLSIISEIEKKGDRFEITKLQLKRISARSQGNHVIPVSTFFRCTEKFFIGKDFFEAVKDLSFVLSKLKKKRFRYYSSIEKSFEELRKSHLGTTKLQQSIQSKLTLEEMEKLSKEFEISQKSRLKAFLSNELIPFVFFAWDERLTSVYYQHRTLRELDVEGQTVRSVNRLFGELLKEDITSLDHFKRRIEEIRGKFFNAIDLPLHVKLGFSGEESGRTNLSKYLMRRFKIITQYLGDMIEYELAKKIRIEEYSALDPSNKKVEILKEILKLNKQSDGKKYQEKCRKIEDSCEREDILKYFNEFKIKREFNCIINEFKKVNECSGQYLEIVEKFFQDKEIGADFGMLKNQLTYVLKILSLLQDSGNGDFSTIGDCIDEMAKDDLAYIIYDARKLFQAWVYIMELAQGHSYQKISNYAGYLNNFFSKKSFVLALIEHQKKENNSGLVKRLEELSKDVSEGEDDELELSFDYDVQSANVMPPLDSLSGDTARNNSDINQADYSVIFGNISENIKNHTVIYNLLEKNLKEGCSIFDKIFLDVAVKHIAGKKCQVFVVQDKDEFLQIIKTNESKNVKGEKGFERINIAILKNTKGGKRGRPIFGKFITYESGNLKYLEEIKCGPHVVTLGYGPSDNFSQVNTLTSDLSSMNAMLHYIGWRLSPILDHSSILGRDVYEYPPEIKTEVPSSNEHNKFPSYIGEYYNGVIGQVLRGQVKPNTAVFECDALLKKPLVCLYVEHLIQEGSHNRRRVQKLFLNTPDYVDHWEKMKKISGYDWYLKNQIDGENKSSSSNNVQLSYVKYEPFSSELSSSSQDISYYEKVAKGAWEDFSDEVCVKTELLDPKEITQKVGNNQLQEQQELMQGRSSEEGELPINSRSHSTYTPGKCNYMLQQSSSSSGIEERMELDVGDNKGIGKKTQVSDAVVAEVRKDHQERIL